MIWIISGHQPELARQRKMSDEICVRNKRIDRADAVAFPVPATGTKILRHPIFPKISRVKSLFS